MKKFSVMVSKRWLSKWNNGTFNQQFFIHEMERNHFPFLKNKTEDWLSGKVCVVIDENELKKILNVFNIDSLEVRDFVETEKQPLKEKEIISFNFEEFTKACAWYVGLSEFDKEKTKTLVEGFKRMATDKDLE